MTAEFIDEERLERLLADAPGIECARAILYAVQRRHDEEDLSFKMNPRVDNNNFRNDHRYKLGMIAAFKEVLDLPEGARVRISLKERGGRK